MLQTWEPVSTSVSFSKVFKENILIFLSAVPPPEAML